MIARLGRIQIRNANRAMNATVGLLALLHLAGVSTLLPRPLPAVHNLAEAEAFLVGTAILLYVRWQARLSRRLLSSL